MSNIIELQKKLKKRFKLEVKATNLNNVIKNEALTLKKRKVDVIHHYFKDENLYKFYTMVYNN
jgi:hypothetical protein